jgi:hypothetical protein
MDCAQVEAEGDAFPGEGRAWVTPATISRYAVAREGDFERARTNILETLVWRQQAVPAHLACPCCEADPHSHCLFPIGLDDLRRLVIYSNAAKATIYDTVNSVIHLVHTLEHAWRSTDALQVRVRTPPLSLCSRQKDFSCNTVCLRTKFSSAQMHHQFVWLIDFSGFTLWHVPRP